MKGAALSIHATAPVHSTTVADAATPTDMAPSLIDLMSDGFYLLLLLRRGQLPADEGAFIQCVQSFLQHVEQQAAGLGLASEDVTAAKYAFCAAVDEAILPAVPASRVVGAKPDAAASVRRTPGG